MHRMFWKGKTMTNFKPEDYQRVKELMDITPWGVKTYRTLDKQLEINEIILSALTLSAQPKPNCAALEEISDYVLDWIENEPQSKPPYSYIRKLAEAARSQLKPSPTMKARIAMNEYKLYTVKIRRGEDWKVRSDLNIDAVDGKQFLFRPGWDITREDSSIYVGEVAMIPYPDNYPHDAPGWIASGDLSHD